MVKRIAYVGLDVHKETIEVAIADEGREGEVRHYGRIGGEVEDVDSLLKKLRKEKRELHFVYEAGPCGYVIYRFLKAKGYKCTVVSPAHIPKSPGVRIKNDRRDALNLARLMRAGELTAVYVPGEEDEAMRDLVRGREDAVKAQRVARQQLKSMLLRHGIRKDGGQKWGKQFFEWLSKLKMPTSCQQIVFQDYINAIKQAEERVDRLTAQISEEVKKWRMREAVEALQSLRGISVVASVTLIAELGDISRFESPSQLMAFLGLVPSVHSSGQKTRLGPITKTGNRRARQALVEAAQSYRYQARVSRQLLARQEGVSQKILDIAWKCQVRLCGKFARLRERCKHHNTVVAATARELAGFVWAVFREIQVPA